ncbi:MAG: hypothetical protein BAA04_13115 [Firmicutes bacterium ZCTH02-B6]|nr:MAG: hypothetical protein BAA04_13115 [Firmicutes bacterium ZCTH02-B6]
MMRAMAWGLLGFAAGAYLVARADSRTKRAWRRSAKRMGRRVERAAARAMGSRGMQWVAGKVQSLAGS